MLCSKFKVVSIGSLFHFFRSSPTLNIVPVLQSFRRVSWFNGAGKMPINRLLEGSKLGPEEIKKLNAAYTYALRSLSVVDRNDPLSEMLARKIIEVGETESDPTKISEVAIKMLKV